MVNFICHVEKVIYVGNAIVLVCVTPCIWPVIEPHRIWLWHALRDFRLPPQSK